jgi:broad specificity phosphatase PhoE
MSEGGRAAERMITFMLGAEDDETFARAERLPPSDGQRGLPAPPAGRWPCDEDPQQLHRRSRQGRGP